jgi:iron complex outermembrane recepter protein
MGDLEMRGRVSRRGWTGAIAVAIVAANPAHAEPAGADKQASSPPPSDAQPAATERTSDARADAGVEQVVVTAEKRQVDLQQAPLSITAVSDKVLQQSHITDPLGLNGYVPGLQINPAAGGEVMVSIRGVGSQTPENFFTQPGVSYHIDGVYIPNNIALNMGFLDVSRIEVLRGPQGTVYGQSSTGGTINVVSNQPKLGTFGGELTTTVGNYKYAMEKLSLNVPIGETFAVRAVVQKTAHDGFSTATSVPGGWGLDDANNINYKLSALWEPTPDLSFILSTQQYRDNHHGAALKALDDPNPDPRQLTQDFPGTFGLKMNIETLTAKYTMPWATLKSLTSYQHMDSDQSWDADRSDIAHFGGYDTVAAWQTHDRTWGEEVTLTSNPGTSLDWIAGIFYMHSLSGQYVLEYKGTNASDPTPILPTNTSPAAIPSNLSYENLSSVVRESWAPFVQATYHVTDRLRLTAGGRYNMDDIHGTGSNYFADPVATTYQDATPTGKLESDYDLTSSNMIYASWSRGYKPGGVNTGTQGAEVVSSTFNPETVDSYEVGSKNHFFDNHLSFNLSGFFAKYANMQYIQEDPIPYHSGIGNIPRVDIWGAEAEAKYRLLDNRLELGGNLTTMSGRVLDHYYALDKELADAATAASSLTPYTAAWYALRAAQSVDLYGKTPPNVPSLAGALNASWLQAFPGYGALTSRIEYLYRGNYVARVFHTASIDDVPAYDQWNLFFEYVPEAAPWKVSLNITNLFDRAGVLGRYVDPYGSGVVSNQYIPPRQILLTFNYKF